MRPDETMKNRDVNMMERCPLPKYEAAAFEANRTKAAAGSR